MIRRKVKQYIIEERLILSGQKVLIALSGGADSVALLCLLQSMGYDCEAAHCNFHLRGIESDRDEAFVRHLCQEQNVPLHLAHFETENYATMNKISIEMAARQLRYDWFSKVKEETQAIAIAVAHHKDDSVETVLLNLIRGTGINGLLGIHPRNGDIVRPLLCVNREEIICYLQHINQDYVTDSTNLQDEYTRNKIRLNILPLMQDINPSVKQSIIDTSNYLSEVALLYHKGIEEGKQRILHENRICISALLNEPSPKALLFEILYPLGFNATQTDNLFLSLNGQSGKQFLGNGWRVIKDRGWVLIEREMDETRNIAPHLFMKEQEYTSEFCIPRKKSIACFDADKLPQALTIRKWKAGDRFIPFGMKGGKLISDYLTDRKFSLSQKENQWLLCCGEQIVWLIGERADNRFRIDELTRKIVIISLIPIE